MKKTIFYILSFSLLVSLFTGCQRKKVDMTTKVKVVTTIYPIYDWTRNLLEEQSNNTLLLSMVVKNGVDLHSYQPSAMDIAQITNSGLFIYIGGESDKWIEDALKASPNENRIELKLMDVLKDNIVQEDELNYFEDEEDELEDEIEYDEHIWLSPKNAIICCNAITEKLCLVDEANAEKYTELNKNYIERLVQLDSDYKFVGDNAKNKVLLFCDRFPFRYLTDAYDFEYYAAFPGCSAETEASFETVKFLTQKIGELDLHAVFVTESSDKKMSRTVIANSAHPMSDTYVLDAMQNTTLAQAFKGKGYIETMYKNLDEIKKAVK